MISQCQYLWLLPWLLLLLDGQRGVAANKQLEELLWPGKNAIEGKILDKAGKDKGGAKPNPEDFTQAECSQEKLDDLAGEFPEDLKMAPLLALICEHTLSPHARVEAKLIWAQATRPLHKAEKALKKRLVREISSRPLAERHEAWDAFDKWVHALALETDMMEYNALVALRKEAAFWERIELNRAGQDRRLDWLLDTTQRVVLHYSRAGRFEDAKRSFDKFLELRWPAQDSESFPIKHFFDTKDYLLADPEPGLTHLAAPIDLDTNKLLPAPLVKRLRTEWPILAQEAKAALDLMRGGGDAFPTINRGNLWSRLTIYDTDGWRDDLCNSTLKHMCEMLKGSVPLHTDDPNAKMKDWLARGVLWKTDETIGLFGVKAGGWAARHSGQGSKVNVHLCLANCNNSRINIARKDFPYHDGSLFAFEDRAQHEVLNDAPAGAEERINLVIGVLHPDYHPDKGKRRGRNMRLDWWLDQFRNGLEPAADFLVEAYTEASAAQDVNAVKYLDRKGKIVRNPPEDLQDILHNAAKAGHISIASTLLELKANPNAIAGEEKTSPLNYAAVGGHYAMTDLLLKNKANPNPKTEGESPLDAALGEGHTAIADLLKEYIPADHTEL